MEECSAHLARSTSDGSADDGKRFHLSGSAGVVCVWARPSWGRGSGGEGAGFIAARAPADFAPPPPRETSSTNRSLGGLITRILCMIVVLAPYESQMGCLNHMYFMYDGALGRFHAAVGPLRSLHFYV